MAKRSRLRPSPKRSLRTVSLAAVFFLAACSPHGSTSTLPHRGHRLHTPESLCGGETLLNPPTSTEYPRVPAPRITKSDVRVRFVGPPPVPDTVYARVRITGMKFPDVNNTPEWVVIYRNVKIIPIGGKIGAEPRPVAHETVLLLFDSTSGFGLVTHFCSSGV